MILTIFLDFSLMFISEYLKRREGDSNPRTALGGYTLSRRASSATRAPFLIWWCKSKTFILNSDGNGRKNHFFPQLLHLSGGLSPKTITSACFNDAWSGCGKSRH